MRIINADNLAKSIETAIDICKKNNMSGDGVAELESVLACVNENAVDFDEVHGKLQMNYEKAQEEIRLLKLENAELRGTVKGLKFSVRCNGVCGNEVV